MRLLEKAVVSLKLLRVRPLVACVLCAAGAVLMPLPGSRVDASSVVSAAALPVRISLVWRWERVGAGRYDLRVYLKNTSRFTVEFDDFENVMVNGVRQEWLENMIDPPIRPGQTLSTTVGFRRGYAGRSGSKVNVSLDVWVWVNGTRTYVGTARGSLKLP